MKSSELLPSYDNLRKTFVNDTIGRSADVIRFASMLNVIDSNFSIALDSSWGSGKTFFVKQVKMFLDANNDHVHTIPEPDKSLFQSKWSDFSRKSMPDFQPQVCVYYDAWANDGDEDPVLSLVYEIINDVESDYSLPKDGDCIKIASTDKTFDEQIRNADESIRVLYENLSNYILSLGDDISESHLKLYAAFKKIRNVVTVVAQKKKLILNLPLDVSTVSFEEGFSRDVTNIGHWGCGAVELYLQSGADFEKAKPLIDRAFDEN